MSTAYTAWNTSQPLTFADKLWRIHWPVLLTTCLLAGIGAAALYSVSGGSFQPWAERHIMRSLDERMLRDVGLSRADIERELLKPFWER